MSATEVRLSFDELRQSTDENSGGDGRTALHLAAEHGHLAIVKVLAENGADVNYRGTSLVRLITTIRSRQFRRLLDNTFASGSRERPFRHCDLPDRARRGRQLRKYILRLIDSDSLLTGIQRCLGKRLCIWQQSTAI
jgi:hypothetical protein